MKRHFKFVLTLIIVLGICGVNIAQQTDKTKKQKTKPKIKKEKVIKKDTVVFPDSVLREMELHQGLLLRDTSVVH